MWGYEIIGLKKKEKRFKEIIRKLLSKEQLSQEDLEFLKKEKVITN